MNESFIPVEINMDEVVNNFLAEQRKEDNRELYSQLNLPGSDRLADPDPAKAREAARELLTSFLMAGSGEQ